jgi:hypothetical protein
MDAASRKLATRESASHGGAWHSAGRAGIVVVALPSQRYWNNFQPEQNVSKLMLEEVVDQEHFCFSAPPLAKSFL